VLGVVTIAMRLADRDLGEGRRGKGQVGMGKAWA